MRINYKQINRLDLIADCTQVDIITHMQNNNAKKGNTRAIWSLIKTKCPELGDALGLNDVSLKKYVDYYNPYAAECLITDKQIMVTHSAVNYLFNYN